MKRLLLIFVAAVVLLPATPRAETHASKYSRLVRMVQSTKMHHGLVAPFLAGVANVYYYDTAAELLSATPSEGVVGYAIDTNAFYLRAGAAWVGLAGLGSVTGANGGTLDNATNNVWKFTEGATAEDLTLTASANLWTFASSTAATLAFTPATAIAGDLTLNGAAGALTFGQASSSVVVPNNSATGLVLGSSGLANLLTLDTRTDLQKVMVTGTTTATAFHVDLGLALFDETVTIGGGAGAITLTNSAASVLLIDNDTSALDIGAAGKTALLRVSTEDNLEKVTISGTTATTSFSVPVGESSFVEGVTAPILATAYDHIRFCGQGSNGSTANYIGPVVEGDYATDMTFGGAGCDAKDNTTEGSAAAAANAFAYSPTAMVCKLAAGGTDDVVTFQLRAGAADVTGMACSVTVDGAAAKQCVVRDPSPAAVAAGDAIAVKVTAVDDNVSGVDAECRVFVIY